jgi:RNA polymerase sigma factor (TIGR02999 family)
VRSDVTQVLHAIEAGDSAAADSLLPLVYDELRDLANTRLAREQPGQTLQATALVHEAYLRLLGPQKSDAIQWNGRGHFFAAAAQAMRRILIDRAREKGSAKRGGSWQRLPTDLTRIALDDVPTELIELDQALTRMRDEEPEKASLVELRFFAGLTMEQAAAVLGISPATAGRYWGFARSWLYDEMQREQGRSAGSDARENPGHSREA